MSSATNKDFSEGEISSIIMGDSNKIWDFIWQLPEFLECPFVLISSCYFTFSTIGYYGFIVVFLTFTQFSLSYYRENSEKDVHKEIREKTDKRMLHINESFQILRVSNSMAGRTSSSTKLKTFTKKKSLSKTLQRSVTSSMTF